MRLAARSGVCPIEWNSDGCDIGFLLLAARLTGSARGLASPPEEPERKEGEDDDTEDEHWTAPFPAADEAFMLLPLLQ